MNLLRRRLLAAMALSPLLAAPTGRALRAATGRVVIVGGGWGGLAAAASLRRLAPELDVTLIERQPRFFSLPLSNRWLAGTLDPTRLWRDPADAARRHAYRLVRATVDAIDRDRRSVHAGGEQFAYDWLILACGIRHDYAAWFGADREAARHAEEQHGAAWRTGDEVAALIRKVETFAGGDLLMTLPPGPARCPPAPYERAIAIAHRLRRRGVKGRLILLDPGVGILGFRELFARHYADIITHVTHAQVKAVDPWQRSVRTEFDEFRFDAAILMPSQQAGDLVWQAGLIGTDAAGRPTGWAAQDPLRLQALADERVFVVGDLIGAVSPLFGHYSKTAHIAAGLGAIAAAEIAARAHGRLADPELPEGLCHVASAIDPPAAIRIHASYRRRGDGVIMQTVRQQHDPQPRDEDLAWLAGLLATLF